MSDFFFIDTTAKKLVDAGKPVPQSRVPLPPLVTPPGTSITIGTPPQQGSSGANTPLRVNAPQSNGSPAVTKATAGSGKAATTVEEAADDDEVSLLPLHSTLFSCSLPNFSFFSSLSLIPLFPLQLHAIRDLSSNLPPTSFQMPFFARVEK